MYARVTTFQGQPGTTEEGIRIFEAAAPQLKGVKGFVATQLLLDRTANTALVVTLYETLADLEAGATLFQQVTNANVAAILASPPVVAVYEVAVQVAAHP